MNITRQFENKQHFLIGFILAAAALFVAGQFAPSRDLLALWLAGDAVASGNPAGIYPPVTGEFMMRPPIAWYARAAEIGQTGEVYPYVYPPIWAWLFAPLTKVMTFQVFKSFFFVFNVICLVAIPFFAARLAGVTTGHPLRNWMLLSGFLILTSQAGIVALKQGQLQIVVAFLTLLALERAQAGRASLAGIAMGVAIALKLSPLPLVLLWLATGQYRPVLWAALAGGSLGLASLLVAGWPLHDNFLVLLGTIDRTMLITTITYAFDTLLGGLSLFGPPEVIPLVPPEITDPNIIAAASERTVNWLVLPKPGALATFSHLALLAVLAVSAVLLRQAETRQSRATAWAIAMTGLAFFGPIGWAYYYLAPFAFAPLVAIRFGKAGTVALVVMGLCYLDVTKWLLWALAGLTPMLTIGLVTLGYLSALLAMALIPARAKPRVPNPEKRGDTRTPMK